MRSPPAAKGSRRALRYGLIGGGLVALVAVVIVFFPWNVLRGPLAAYLSTRFERTVTIDGNLAVDLGWTTRVRIDGVSVANVGWSQSQPMARIGQVDLWFTPTALLRAEPAQARLTDASVILERRADGNDNWHLGLVRTARIGNVAVARGVVRFLDAKGSADITLHLQTVSDAEKERSNLRFNGEGTLHGEAVELAGTSVGLAQLQNVDDPYRLTLTARAGRSSVRFDGTIVPSDTESVHGALRLQGPDLSKLNSIVPAPLPWTPPYDLAGDLTHRNGLWDFRGLRGTVGQSDLQGDLRIDTSGPRSVTTADLKSARFDTKDLGAFIGLPPENTTQRVPDATTRMSERPPSSRILPQRVLGLATLREHDAEVTFRGTSVKWGAIPMDNLSAHLSLKDGVLRFHPLDFGLADGHLVINLSVDATRGSARLQGEAVARNIELKRIWPTLASPKGTAGRFGGRVRFSAQGNTVASMLGSADGDAAVIMRGGEASTLQLVLTNLDLARASELMLRGDQTAAIRCAVAALHSKSGVMSPELLTVDTSAVVINGEGQVDFHEETYDLMLKAASKRPSLLALRGPIVIRGTFKTPVVGPAAGPVMARVGAAIGLGSVAPPLALLPLIDFGGASDVDCRGLIEQANERAGTTARASPTPTSTRDRPARTRVNPAPENEASAAR